MSTAAYTYQRENRLREKLGFLSLYDASQIPKSFHKRPTRIRSRGASRKEIMAAHLEKDGVIEQQVVEAPETKRATFAVETMDRPLVKTATLGRFPHQIYSQRIHSTRDVGTQTDNETWHLATVRE